MPSYTLADIQREADAKYAPVDITLASGQVVHLRSLLRVSDAERKAIVDALKTINAEDSDDVENLAELAPAIDKVLTTVADGGMGNALLTAVGGDLGLKLELIKRWSEASQPGEAPRSPVSSETTAAS